MTYRTPEKCRFQTFTRWPSAADPLVRQRFENCLFDLDRCVRNRSVVFTRPAGRERREAIRL